MIATRMPTTIPALKPMIGCKLTIVAAAEKHPKSIKPSIQRFVTPDLSENRPPRDPIRRGMEYAIADGTIIWITDHITYLSSFDFFNSFLSALFLKILLQKPWMITLVAVK